MPARKQTRVFHTDNPFLQNFHNDAMARRREAQNGTGVRRFFNDQSVDRGQLFDHPICQITNRTEDCIRVLFVIKVRDADGVFNAFPSLDVPAGQARSLRVSTLDKEYLLPGVSVISLDEFIVSKLKAEEEVRIGSPDKLSNGTFQLRMNYTVMTDGIKIESVEHGSEERAALNFA